MLGSARWGENMRFGRLSEHEIPTAKVQLLSLPGKLVQWLLECGIFGRGRSDHSGQSVDLPHIFWGCVLAMVGILEDGMAEPLQDARGACKMGPPPHRDCCGRFVTRAEPLDSAGTLQSKCSVINGDCRMVAHICPPCAKAF